MNDGWGIPFESKASKVDPKRDQILEERGLETSSTTPPATTSATTVSSSSTSTPVLVSTTSEWPLQGDEETSTWVVEEFSTVNQGRN